MHGAFYRTMDCDPREEDRGLARCLNESVKNPHDGEEKAIRYQLNLSLQDEGKLS